MNLFERIKSRTPLSDRKKGKIAMQRDRVLKSVLTRDSNTSNYVEELIEEC